MSNFKTIVNNIQKQRTVKNKLIEEQFILNQVLDRHPSPSQLDDGGKGQIPIEGEIANIPTGIEVVNVGTATPHDGSQQPQSLKRNLQLKKLIAMGANPSKDNVPTLFQHKRFLEQELETVESKLNQSLANLDNLDNPQELVQHLKDDFPFVLLPVRLETRFLEENNEKFLGVRFFPDDIFISTHEKVLTQDEIESGQIFWKLLWDKKIWEGKEANNNNPSDEETHRAAWRGIARANGANRAAWIIIQTKPSNWPTSGGSVAKNPSFPKLAFKNNSWASPPITNVLPDKFVTRLYANGAFKEIVGNQIPNPLIVGPDPNADDLFTDTGEVTYLPMKWLVDFEEAVKIGMGVKIKLTEAESKQGFDKILALGIKLSANEQGAQNLTENLVNDLHYSPAGFSLVPQGTPTNNSGDTGSGYSVFNPDLDFLFNIERQEKLFDPAANSTDKSDGAWLTHLLGIQDEPLQHIAYADFKDRMEAQVMNEALWTATGEYFIKQLLCHPFDLLDNIENKQELHDQIKELFINNVSGRGGLPAIRVGNQPYGILTVTDYTNFKPHTKEDNILGLQEFLLASFDIEWKKQINKVNTVSNGTDNWQANFINILSLHATSQEYFWRVGIGPQLYFHYLTSVLKDPVKAKELIDAKFKEGFISFTSRVEMLNWYPFSEFGGKLDLDLITNTSLSEENPLDESNNYLAYLADSNNIPSIISEYLNKEYKSNTLLYRLLRHALLLNIYYELWKQKKGELWIEKEILNINPEECDAIWKEYYMDKEGKSINPAIIDDLSENKNITSYFTQLAKLKDIPTARLERLLVEHIDLCSYRLDAWQAGLVDLRLQGMRENHPQGHYLGAFGWLLDIRPENNRELVPNGKIPAQLKNSKEKYPLTYEPDNAGFIHAPSLAQATTGAILRENYISKDRKSMEVNLDSRRVRLANEIIEGIKNGQELGALLGYRFERTLHNISESKTGVELDKYIYQLRKNFPLNNSKDANPAKKTEANNVIHGLNLLKAYRANPSLNGLISPTTGDKVFIDAALVELEDIIDALADTTMAEGVYQTVMGNHDRAGAILNAVGQGKLISEPEFIKTPRTGIPLTQKVGIVFKANQILSNKWKEATESFRAKANQPLNAWLGKVLGNPENIKCKIQYELQEKVHNKDITVLDLHIHPIDFVYLMNSSTESEQSQLSHLIAYHSRRKIQGLKETDKIMIDYRDRTGWKNEEKSFFEMLALCKYLFKLISESSSLGSNDFKNASTIVEDLEKEKDEIKVLWKMLYDIQLPNKIDSLENQINGLKNASLNPNKLIQARQLLLEFSSLDVVGILPKSLSLDEDAKTETLEKLETLHKFLKGKYKEIDDLFNEDSTYPNPQVLTKKQVPIVHSTKDLTKIIKKGIQLILGAGFPVLTKFKIDNFQEISSCYKDKELLIQKNTKPLVVDNWLHGVSKVKDKLKNWQNIEQIALLLSEQTTLPSFKLTPLQLPYQAKDQWLGVEFDPSSINIAGDPLSLVLNFTDDLGTNEEEEWIGLIIDQWVETIPFNKETTGIAFNYDAPSSEPPQAILLAVPPTLTGTWNWDSLMNILNETLSIAQKRAIDSDDLVTEPEAKYTNQLPGIMVAISSNHTQTVALNFHDLHKTTPTK